MRSALLLSAALLPAPALAVSTTVSGDLAAVDEAPGEEVVVTGERVSRTVRETASSVSVATGEDIRDQADATRVEDVLKLIPNVQLGAGDSGPTIRGDDTAGVLRGADAFLGGSRPRTTIFLDGRPLNYNEFIYGSNALWDVERVEVFRGPQTTTQGRNAIAGAIFIETSDPTFAWSGAARALVGDHSTEGLSAALGGPIVADQIAFRGAVDLRDQRSYVRRPTQTRADIGEDPRKDDYWVGRLKLLATPEALPGVRLGLTYNHLDSTAPQGEAVNRPFRDYTSLNAEAALFRTRSDTLVGDLSIELGRDFDLATRVTFADIDVQRLTIKGGGDADVDARELSGEAILSWRDTAAPVSGRVGAYVFGSEQDEAIDLSLFLAEGAFRDEADSLGLFGEASVRPAERLLLTAGLRYQRDRQDREGALGPFAVNYDRSFDAWLPRFVAAYDVSDAIRVGASATRGFNPGGTTISFNTGEQDVFGAETLWSYELFARATLAPGVTLNGNVFTTDFDDAQRITTTIVNGEIEGEIDNAEDARSLGAEIDIAWRLSERVRLRGGVGLLDTELERYSLSTEPIEGKAFARAPGFSAFAAVGVEPVAGLELDAQGRYADGYFSDDLNSPDRRIGSRFLLDAQASYRWRNARVFAFARNLFDRFYLTELYAPDFGTVGEPRRVGAGVEVMF